jgi:DNA-binding response OmpR family regulator
MGETPHSVRQGLVLKLSQIMKDNESLAASEPSGNPPQSQTNPSHRILVVEDDILIRQLNTVALLRSGYDVDAAEDGDAAWKALSADCYDLVITDNSMPKVTGIELLKKMRAGRMELPVIMATGVLPKEEFNRHPWLQPEAMLAKPYTIEEMLSIVKKVLGEADAAADSSRRFKLAELSSGKNSEATDPVNPIAPNASISI